MVLKKSRSRGTKKKSAKKKSTAKKKATIKKKKAASQRTPKQKAQAQTQADDEKPLSEQTTTELASEFADTTDILAEFKGKMAKHTAKLKLLSAALKDRFIEAGMQSINVHGRTVYLHRQLWAKKAQARDAIGDLVTDEKNKPVPIDTALVVEAMREAGDPWEQLCYETFNTASLSGLIRDENICARDDDDFPQLPPELENIITVSEELSIKARKA